MGENIKRESIAVTYNYEKPILDNLARKVYRSLTADQLSGIALLGTILIAIFYWYAGSKLVWLHIVNVGIFLHWFGDSLDGRVAVLRGEGRPKYGHYLDHILDAVSTVIILLGIHLSGLTTENFWLFGTISSLFYMTHVHLKTSVTGVFDFTQSLFGPTELRILLIIFNLFAVVTGNPNIDLLGFDYSLFDWAGLTYFIAVSFFALKNISSSLWGRERIEDG